MENDRDFKMCGKWIHKDGPLKLAANVTTGCAGVNISADDSTLLIQASITRQCTNNTNTDLEKPFNVSVSNFCVFWDPLLDLLIVEINRRNYTVCKPTHLQTRCCTDISARHQGTAGNQGFGIKNCTVHGDLLNDKVLPYYDFNGIIINCSKTCILLYFIH